MKLKTLIAAALVAAGGSALAADQSIDISSGLASFMGTSPLFDGGDDVITFTGAAPGTYDFLLTFSGFGFDLSAADLNGIAGTPIAMNGFRFLGIDGTSSPDFKLTLTGATTSKMAAYSGEMRITPVPEPETYAMFLAGLGALGFVARRRKQA
jgi:hypothetical protein